MITAYASRWQTYLLLAIKTFGAKLKLTLNLAVIPLKFLVNSIYLLLLVYILLRVMMAYFNSIILDVPNPSQLQNIALANSIYDHNELVKRMIINLEPTFVNTVSASNILESLNHGSNIVLRVVKQLTHSMKSAANIILLSIHREPGLNSDRTLPMGSSLYMKELQEFLHRAWNCHILPFKDKQIVEGCGKELADSCVELLMWNIAIIRPISSSGRQRIKNDCQHLESTLSPLIGDITAIGRTFRLEK